VLNDATCFGTCVFIQAVLGSGIEISDIPKWLSQGLEAYSEYVATQCQSVHHSIFSPFLVAIGFAKRSILLDLIHFVLSVIQFLKEHDVNSTSVEEMVDIVLKQYKVNEDIASDIREYGAQAIFTIIYWLTILMLIKPCLQFSSTHLRVLMSLSNQISIQSSLEIFYASQPIPTCLREFGDFVPRPAQNTLEPAGILSASIIQCLPRYSLKSIGKINIIWVDALSTHLDFQPLTRTLMPFRFPSFCALSLWERTSNQESHSYFDW